MLGFITSSCSYIRTFLKNDTIGDNYGRKHVSNERATTTKDQAKSLDHSLATRKEVLCTTHTVYKSRRPGSTQKLLNSLSCGADTLVVSAILLLVDALDRLSRTDITETSKGGLPHEEVDHMCNKRGHMISIRTKNAGAPACVQFFCSSLLKLCISFFFTKLRWLKGFVYGYNAGNAIPNMETNRGNRTQGHAFIAFTSPFRGFGRSGR